MTFLFLISILSRAKGYIPIIDVTVSLRNMRNSTPHTIFKEQIYVGI